MFFEVYLRTKAGRAPRTNARPNRTQRLGAFHRTQRLPNNPALCHFMHRQPGQEPGPPSAGFRWRKQLLNGAVCRQGRTTGANTAARTGSPAGFWRSRKTHAQAVGRAHGDLPKVYNNSSGHNGHGAGAADMGASGVPPPSGWGAPSSWGWCSRRPCANAMPDVGERMRLIILVGKRFNKIAVPSLVVLMATGLYNSHALLANYPDTGSHQLRDIPCGQDGFGGSAGGGVLHTRQDNREGYGGEDRGRADVLHRSSAA